MQAQEYQKPNSGGTAITANEIAVTDTYLEATNENVTKNIDCEKGQGGYY